MHILIFCLIFGFAVAKDKTPNIFRPNFGPQKQVVKVLQHRCGLTVKLQSKPLGSENKSSNNTLIVTVFEGLVEDSRECGDFSNELIDDSRVSGFDSKELNTLITNDLVSEGIFFANYSNSEDYEDELVSAESGSGEAYSN